MSKSILQPDMTKNMRKCYLTGETGDLHKHHIYPGPNRKISDKYGFWVWIVERLHNGNDPAAVHKNPNNGYDLLLKQQCQRVYEELGFSREEFMSLIGKSYL